MKILKTKVQECDVTGEAYPYPVEGAHIFDRGATGRVCCVMYAGPEYVDMQTEEAFSSLDDIKQWAESVPGGWLDYKAD